MNTHYSFDDSDTEWPEVRYRRMARVNAEKSRSKALAIKADKEALSDKKFVDKTDYIGIGYNDGDVAIPRFISSVTPFTYSAARMQKMDRVLPEATFNTSPINCNTSVGALPSNPPTCVKKSRFGDFIVSDEGDSSHMILLIFIMILFLMLVVSFGIIAALSIKLFSFIQLAPK